MSAKLIEIYNYRDMISSLVRRELRGKYAKSVLGFLWSLLNPMFQILVYTAVFTIVFRNDLENYYIFLMTGLFPWTFFSDSFNTGAVSIIINSEMVKKIYFPREVLVISEVNAKLINLFLSFIVMSGFLLVSGTGFSWHLIFLPVIVVAEYMFALGCALFVSAVTVYLRDMEYIVNVITMAWVWATPVMYQLDNISGIFHRILTLNPMTPLIVSYQDILYWHRTPYVVNLLVPLVEGAVVMIIGELIFHKFSKRFVEEL